ncbi:unnamed protein product [Caenorhabditis angaria]|uniref:Globin domain-containing protein n=1 Tax=Caenorhabditis angaria TaxID=860376 RepID=A0A9P1IKS6_9PELO|nr:unnamed protein product [Caenorhabditis angaria]
MGNENSSMVKIRKFSKGEKEPSVIIECVDGKIHPPTVLRKKSSRRRSVSQSRLPLDANETLSITGSNNKSKFGAPPIPQLIQTQLSVDDAISIGSRKSSVSNFRLSSDGSGDSLLSPLQTTDRRRSRSLCSAQMKDDAQAVANQHNKEKEEKTGGSSSTARKASSGLVPSLNRLRIQQCYKTAKPSIGDAIMKRAAATRAEMRNLLAKMNDKQIECLGKQMYELITNAVENADKSDKVLQHARQFGETYAALVPLGFRPDLFAPLADAAIAECVKLDGVHKRCETLSAWSQLFSALFSAVRDGYYQRVRHQRRTSLPQNTITKQLSVDFSKTGDVSIVR